VEGRLCQPLYFDIPEFAAVGRYSSQVLLAGPQYFHFCNRPYRTRGSCIGSTVTDRVVESMATTRVVCSPTIFGGIESRSCYIAAVFGGIASQDPMTAIFSTQPSHCPHVNGPFHVGVQ